MIPPRWTKVVRDLFSNKVRTLLVALSIGIGVFTVGFVTTTYVITSQDLDLDYRAAQAHSGYIYSDPFDEDLAASMSKVPGVRAAEGRSVAGGTVSAPDGSDLNVYIYSIPKPSDLKIDILRPFGGKGSVPDLRFKEVLVEGSAIPVFPIKVGDTLPVKMSDERIRELRVVGLVHDATIPSTGLTRVVYVYVSPETMAWLGGSRDFIQMLFAVSDRPRDETYIRQVAEAVAHKISGSGRTVYATVVYQPGRHPVESVVQSLLLLMGGFGVLSVLLSGFLVVNTVNALLSQQTRQIGMMKAIGAHTSQVVALYIVMVLGFGLVALLIALPLSTLIANGMLSGMSTMLNFNSGGFRVPAMSVILQAVVALLLPALAGLVPVLKGARTTVQKALSSYGLNGGGFGKGWFDRMIEHVRRLPRPLLISLRNTFRRKGRLLLTLSTLTLGGAIFVAVFNIQGSFSLTIEKTLGYFLSDINLSLYRYARVEQVQKLAMSVPGVVSVEPWILINESVLSADKKTSTEVTIVAPPSDTQLLAPVVTGGRWLIPQDQNALAVGNHFLDLRPEIRVGDILTLNINDREYPFQVVGTYQMAGTVIPPFVYANYEYVSRLMGQPDRASEYRMVIDPRDPATEKRVVKQLQQLFKAAGVPVAGITGGSEIRALQGGGFEVVIYFLTAMALVIAIVGGLGLMGTMSMNVIERTREIGVMRSIGASNRTILGMVVVEGMLIGVLSWLLAVVLAFPISKVINDVVGVAFIRAPMNLVINYRGFIIWLIIVLVISALASLLPAANAARLTVRDVLAYE